MDQMCTLFYLCASLCYFECYPAITLSGGRCDGGGEARLSRSQRGRQIAVASSVGERWRYLGPAVPRRARERPTGDVCARARRQSAIPPHAVRLPEFGLKLIAISFRRFSTACRVHIEPMQPRDRRYAVSSTLSRDAGAGKAHTQCLWRDRPQRRAPTRRPASRSLLSCGQPSRLSRPFCSFGFFYQVCRLLRRAAHQVLLRVAERQP